jgi:hypothetical protein
MIKKGVMKKKLSLNIKQKLPGEADAGYPGWDPA